MSKDQADKVNKVIAELEKIRDDVQDQFDKLSEDAQDESNLPTEIEGLDEAICALENLQ